MLMLTLSTLPAWGNSGQSTGLHFLLTGPSAHNMGVSDGHTAALSGASAVFLNPAMLSLEKGSSATLSYYLWPATDTQNQFAGIHFLRNKNAFGIALLASMNDGIEKRDGPGDPVGLMATNYFSLAASYSRAAGPLSFGATAMYLYEQFPTYDARGYGLNAGLALQLLEERVRFAATLRNLGSMEELNKSATRLPTLLSFGTDIGLLQFSTTAIDEDIPLLVSLVADYNIPLNEIEEEGSDIMAVGDGYLNAGLEINISGIIDLRSGYRTGDTQRKLNFGAGLLVGDFYFNYAFMPFETGFGAAHALSLQYFF